MINNLNIKLYISSSPKAPSYISNGIYVHKGEMKESLN